MDVERFTQDPEVLGSLRGLEETCRGKEFSDVVDDEGRQYVDLVMEGGGVLGIALVGYTYALEQMGLRFLRIGGASAGAINALVMAALDVPSEPKSEEAVRLLANMNMGDFVDGGDDARYLLEALRHEGWFGTAVGAARITDDLRRGDLGLNPGEEFRRWLSGALSERGVRTCRDLGERMRQLPRLERRTPERDGSEEFSFREERDFRLALVVADITTQTKAVFPEMAGLYWRDVDGLDPALLVRASMSIPFFFHPVRRPRREMPALETKRDEWEKLASYYETELPEECLLVDGGIVSNFPIDLFHRRDGGTPAAPTFGAKLGRDKRLTRASGLKSFTWAIFDTARHCLDYDFIHRNPDYKRLLTYIDVENDYDWLDFDMKDEARIGLFREGVKAAAQFLRTFDWGGYKEIRSKTAEVSSTAERLEAQNR